MKKKNRVVFKEEAVEVEVYLFNLLHCDLATVIESGETANPAICPLTENHLM
jgi:hypothetical protein